MNTIKDLINSGQKLIVVPVDGGLTDTLQRIGFAYARRKAHKRHIVVVPTPGTISEYLPWLLAPIPGLSFCRTAEFIDGTLTIDGTITAEAAGLTQKNEIPVRPQIVYVDSPQRRGCNLPLLLAHTRVRPALLPLTETPGLPAGYHAVHIRHTDYKTDYRALLDALPRDGTKYVVCTDSQEVYAYAEQVLGDALHPLPRKRAATATPIHHDYVYATAVEALADLRILAGAQTLHVAPIMSDPKYHYTQTGEYLSGFTRLAQIIAEDHAALSPFNVDTRVNAPTATAVGMASHPPRETGLLAAVPKLLPQCDELFLYLNNYGDDILEKLPYSDKITAILAGEGRHFADLRTRGKHFGAEGWRGYYVTMDDDVLCPDDYTARFRAALVKYSRKVVAAAAGRVISPVHWRQHDRPVPTDTLVTSFSSGACAYCPADIGFTLGIFTDDIMYGDDNFLSIWANTQGIPAVIIQRPADWVKFDASLRFVEAFSANAEKQAYVINLVKTHPWRIITGVGLPPPDSLARTAATPVAPPRRRSFPHNSLGRDTVSRDPRFRHIQSHLR